jgi:hypothetical protein
MGKEMVTMSTQPNRTQQQTGDQGLITGFKKHEQTITSLVVAGTSYKTADIIGILEARIAARNAAVSSKATWQADVKADHDERAKTKAFVAGLQQAVRVAFGGSIDMLADFGLKPHKTRAPRTPAQKAAATAKAKATRAARHTMGSKQKAKVKGTAPQAAPAPAPSPTAAPGAPKPAEPTATGPAPAAAARQS